MTKSPWPTLIGCLVVFILASMGAVYCSGFIFLALSKMNPTHATLTTFYQYWSYYNGDVLYHKRLNISAMLATIFSYGVPIALYIAATRQIRSLHGDARFANESELYKSGLTTTKQGIIVGKHKNRFLIFGGQQFVMLAAPTRSGKGIGIVIPNLLNWEDSVVVLDIKQENFNATAGFREKHGQQVFLFNPFAEDGRSARYNPLGYVRDDTFRISDLMAIGEVLYPSSDRKDVFWDDQARNLFVGFGLYLCETPHLPCTIGEMLRQSSGKGQPIKEYLVGIIDERAKSTTPLSMECVDALNRFINTSDNTRSSILASFNAPLGIWANPIVDAATSFNDFDLREVRKQRLSIYIGITPDHLAEAGRVVNLLFSQLIHLNTKELAQQNPQLKYQCLLLMDEFTAIGKVGIIAKAVSYMAGYNLRLLPIIQSITQLTATYGQDDARTFMTNHALQILFAPREQRDANEYSDMLGFETVKSISKSRQLGGQGSRNESQSDQRRALLLPQEIKEIGEHKEIILLENVKPILCDKIIYHTDPVFIKRVLPIPTVLLLDMDTHQAVLQGRIRAVTVDDVKSGIKLPTLTADLSKISIPDKEPEENEVEDFVTEFFDILDGAAVNTPPTVIVNNANQSDDNLIENDFFENLAEELANSITHVEDEPTTEPLEKTMPTTPILDLSVMSR